MVYCSFCLVLVLAQLSLISSQGGEEAAECHVQGTCKDCIAKQQCAWCSQESFTENSIAVYRCDSNQNLRSKGCDERNISNPKSATINMTNNNVGPSIQVQPQRVALKLRPGAPTTIRLTVRPAEHYPVDLYYLMDMSWSMEDDLSKLKGLAGKIAESMKNITKNFRLGFGSFVDKTVSPYVQPDQINLPCRIPGRCVASYGFKHILSLINNSKIFESEVNKQKISGNIDEPEGGFDALMQVAVCDQKIGWLRKGTSRRLVVCVSDASFHIAGDGKLGGIVTPNDEQCHLDNGVYQKSNTSDYPSIAQLHEKLQENQIQPIFAVTRNVSGVYQGLSSMWDDIGAVTGELALDSRNVVDLIQDSYNKIASTVKLSYKAPPGVQVGYTAECGNQILNQKECTKVGIGQKVYFNVWVKVERCTKEMQIKRGSFPIRVPGFGSVTLDLEYICKCKCEGPDYKEENSSRCSHGNGTYACGQCDCHKGRYGEKCECDSPFDKSEDVDKCKITNSTEEEPCSGNGQCVCGKCVCNADRYGDKCQCSDLTCQKHQKKMCGGLERGVCYCGECKCNKDFLGSNCGELNCLERESRCRRPDSPSAELCSGGDHGTCKCGECRCNRKYTGTHCEQCPTCEGGICSRSRDCITCTRFENNPLEECKKLNRCETVVTSVKLQDKIAISTESHRCEGRVDKCNYYFTYKAGKQRGTFDLILRKKQDCPKSSPAEEIAFGLVAGILLFGLILLILWKLYVTNLDKREVETFELERTRARWQKEKNPLFKAPTTTFTNPGYVGEK